MPSHHRARAVALTVNYQGGFRESRATRGMVNSSQKSFWDLGLEIITMALGIVPWLCARATNFGRSVGLEER